MAVTASCGWSTPRSSTARSSSRTAWPTCPSDRTYALWFIGPDGPEEAALFRTEDGRATRMLDRTPEGFDALGVTEEPAGGSPVPTEPILLQATVDPTV